MIWLLSFPIGFACLSFMIIASGKQGQYVKDINLVFFGLQDEPDITRALRYFIIFGSFILGCLITTWIVILIKTANELGS